MIEWVDISVMQFFRDNFPGYGIVYAHPELAREALKNASILKQQKTPTSQPTDTSGVPGIAIFRTAAPRMWEGFNVPQGLRGRQFSEDPDADGHKGDFNFVKTIPIKVEYQVSVWTKFQSDMNVAERILSFLDLGRYVSTSVKDAAGTINTFKFPVLWGSDPRYSWDFDKNIGKAVYFNIEKTIRVDAQWANSSKVPPIEHIHTLYKQLTSGEDVIETLDYLDNLVALDEVDIPRS